MLDVEHGGEFGFVEHEGHEGAFFDADAVFAAQTAIFAHGYFDHFAARFAYSLHIFLVLRVGDKNEWVQVAVSCVEDMADGQVVTLADFVDFEQRFGQAAARHGDVYGVVGGRETGDSTRRTLTRQPYRVAFLLAGSDAQVVAAMIAQDGSDLLDLFFQARGVSIHLDNQHSGGFGWQPYMQPCLDDGDNLLVHHLHRGRNQSCRDDRRGSDTRLLDRIEDSQHGFDAWRIAHQTHIDGRHERQHPFAAGQYPAEVVFGIIEGASPHLHDATVR